MHGWLVAEALLRGTPHSSIPLAFLAKSARLSRAFLQHLPTVIHCYVSNVGCVLSNIALKILNWLQKHLWYRGFRYYCAGGGAHFTLMVAKIYVTGLGPK